MKDGIETKITGLIALLFMIVLLLAGCSPSYFTLSYDANGAESGNVPAASEGNASGAVITIPGNTGILVKSGYTFIGWNTAVDYSGPTYLEGSSYIIGAADAALYACWSQTTHSLNFNANGGCGSMNEMTVAEGVEVVLPLNTFSRSAFGFSGWAESERGSAEYSDAGKYTPGSYDTTLFAAWRIDIAPNWAAVVNNGSSKFFALACDAEGSIYVAGYQQGTGSYDYGNGVTASGGGAGRNSVIVKYNTSGAAQWAVTVNIGSLSEFFALACDDEGGIYAAGYQYGTGSYDYGNGVTASGGYTDRNSVIVKYNTSGAAQWAVAAFGGAKSIFSTLTCDDAGGIYAAGYQSGTGSYDYGNSVTASGGYGAYNSVIVKYNTSGAAQWAIATDGSEFSEFSALACDDEGGIYAAGYQSSPGSFDYGNGVTASGGYISRNSVIVKYNTSGAAQWAVAAFGGAKSIFSTLACDDVGGIYAAGYQYGTGSFDYGGGITDIGGSAEENSVIVKYNPSGAAQWAVAAFGGAKSIFSTLTCDDAGGIYAAGYQSGTGSYDYGNGVRASGGYTDENSVIVLYEPDGNAQWALAVKGSNASEFSALAFDDAGGIYAAGYQYGTGSYDYGNSVTASDGYTGDNAVIVNYR